ncbi:hypothetical protein [Halolamina sediminis]|uniref:hypothetical protein n=1 Tax=Halolamina sediminis TaxID=1480675 RepID=UPI0006B67DA5|nr:hypothetical protein [Halolamina sediminis]
MDRRTLLRNCAVLGAAGLSGCSGLAGRSAAPDTDSPTRSPTATASPTSTRTETATPEPMAEFLDELVGAIDRETEDWDEGVSVDDVSESFVATLRDDDGYTDNGLAFLDRLETVSESLEMRNAARTAASVAAFDSISDGDLATVDRWLALPTGFQRGAFMATSYPPTGAIAGALVDSSGDGMRDGFLLGTSPLLSVVERLHEPRPIVAEMATNLAGEGYTERAISYMRTVLRYRQYEGNPYERWAQAERQNLLVEATTDGEITEAASRGIGSSSSDRLIDAQAEAFGVDPTRGDTAGDGFPDHLAWLMAEEFGFPVHPTEPDVYVEVAAAEGVDHLSENERERLVDLFANAPGGPIHLHFYEGADDVEPLTQGYEEAVESRAEDGERAGLGHHYVLLNDRDLDFQGEDDRRGLNTGTASWVDGTLPWTERTSVLAHELGHSLGLLPEEFGGIDSEEYSVGEYASVMNYNGPDDFADYNDGDPFDDWEHMRENTFRYGELDVSGLEQTWQNGEPPQ